MGSLSLIHIYHLENDEIRKLIQELRVNRVAVVIAAGNHYFQHNSQQGMAYPAIVRECISVGAVYDAVSYTHLAARSR